MSAGQAAMERVHEQPGVLILFAHSNALSAHDRAVDADEHPNALYWLKHAIDALEKAHKALVHPAGTAILRDGDPEPVDRWAEPFSRWRSTCNDCGAVVNWGGKGEV